MLLEIDHHSGVPIYRQIKDQIREQIMAGRLKEGEQLVSVRELAMQLKVTPVTVSKAYSAMEAEGLLERRRGIGLFIAEIHSDKKEILMHQAIAVENDPDDRACRTKLCAEPVGDIEKLFTQWDKWGWHRVTFYGDLKEPIFALADVLGFRVVEEA